MNRSIAHPSTGLGVNGRLLLCASVALLAWACGQKASNLQLVDNPQGPALPVDHPAVPNLGLVSAYPQRMSVPQLMLTYPQVMGTTADGGTITWMIGNQQGLVTESDALGNPDFINITAEDLSANPLYLKFADDAARDICNKGLNADLARTGPNRVLLPYVSNTDTTTTNLAGINQNLRYLKLRFHGIKIADTDDTSIQPLRDLFTAGVTQNSSAANPVLEGWRLVCVALVTAPEFHVY